MLWTPVQFYFHDRNGIYAVTFLGVWLVLREPCYSQPLKSMRGKSPHGLAIGKVPVPSETWRGGLAGILRFWIIRSSYLLIWFAIRGHYVHTKINVCVTLISISSRIFVCWWSMLLVLQEMPLYFEKQISDHVGTGRSCVAVLSLCKKELRQLWSLSLAIALSVSSTVATVKVQGELHEGFVLWRVSS